MPWTADDSSDGWEYPPVREVNQREQDLRRLFALVRQVLAEGDTDATP